MGIAIAGQIPTGIAIAGQNPAGIAIAGQNVFAGGAPQWQLLNIINTPYPSGTTPAMDTSGANLIVAVLGNGTSAALSVTDSLSNTWTPAVGNGVNCAYSSIHYCINPVTGTSHVFTCLGLSYGGMIVAAFKCVGTPIFSSLNSANQSNQPSIQLPSITVNKDYLVISGTTNCGGNVLSIDSGFHIDKNIARVLAGNIAFASASLISSSSQSLSPIWSGDFSVYPANPYLAATIASFIPSP